MLRVKIIGKELKGMLKSKGWAELTVRATQNPWTSMSSLSNNVGKSWLCANIAQNLVSTDMHGNTKVSKTVLMVFWNQLISKTILIHWNLVSTSWSKIWSIMFWWQNNETYHITVVCCDLFVTMLFNTLLAHSHARTWKFLSTYHLRWVLSHQNSEDPHVICGLFLDPQGAVPPQGPAHKTFEAEHLLSMTKQVGMDGWLALRDVVLLRHDAARCISRGQRKGKPEDVQTTAAGLNPTQNFCLYIPLSPKCI